MVKISRKSQENHEAQFPKFSAFIGQKSIFCCYCIQNSKDGIQVQLYKSNNESINHFSQSISVKVKKKLIKILGSISGKVKKIETQAK